MQKEVDTCIDKTKIPVFPGTIGEKETFDSPIWHTDPGCGELRSSPPSNPTAWIS